jgi:hypothetical protein
LGITLTLAALFFALQRLWSIGRSDWASLLSLDVLWLVLLAGGLHGLNSVLLGWAWHRLLLFFGDTASPRLSIAVYGRTQIAKYLPGNVLHFAGRHVLGNREGLRHPALAGALIYEVMGILIAGGAVSLFAFPAGVSLEGSLALRLLLIPLLLVLPLLVQFVVARFSLGARFGFPRLSIRAGYLQVLPVWAIYILYFVLDGLLLYAIVGVIAGAWDQFPILVAFSAFSISWLSGYLTPGAPAGLGVRDAVMILILTDFIGAPSAAFVTLVSRLVVTLGDVVFFLLSYPLAGKDGFRLSIDSGKDHE